MSIDELSIGLERPPSRLALEGSALFLDLDGTLAPIAKRPEDVGPDRRRNDLLSRLAARMQGRLAVVSGRSLDDIDRILEGRVVCAAAIHGLVRRDTRGVVGEAPPHPGLASARASLKDFAASDPRLLVEDKSLSLTLHYRLAPDRGQEAIDLAERIATITGLTLQPGDMVVELRTPGASKGDAIRAFMAEVPFKGAQPIFLGDDLTDEHGFFAVRQMGGYGVLIGPQRRTTAIYRMEGVEEALSWLEGAA
ncbi:trehalose 6-phosphate phosphatase [Phenylobacterium haematophilum]|uniref:Trehalose 6-phosphate phosphatase n=1 Tax=Phenylobacterium haematophilum TaxID=98513 RepID=A0A840A293_9CAUL|nr:trehalose-phosphatase [Phenylobacterium haematophilum]MBB3892508.1 trehalose 6-phosphate phosphatase [Phenylobacterium haematophilum]